MLTQAAESATKQDSTRPPSAIEIEPELKLSVTLQENVAQESPPEARMVRPPAPQREAFTLAVCMVEMMHSVATLPWSHANAEAAGKNTATATAIKQPLQTRRLGQSSSIQRSTANEQIEGLHG